MSERDRSWRAQGDGLFDEVVMDGDIHIEKMDHRAWTADFGLVPGESVRLTLAFRADGTLYWCHATVTDDAGGVRETTLVDAPRRRARPGARRTRT